MNKYCSLILLPLMVLPSLLHATTDYSDITVEKKRILGYDVQCQSFGDIYLSKEINNHTSKNICNEKDVSIILNAAKSESKPNFARDMKLIRYIPNKKNDLAISVLVDERRKVIIPDAVVFSYRYQNGANNKYSKIANNNLGAVYSSVDSNMYCYTNGNLGFATENTLSGSASYEKQQAKIPLCFFYMGREQQSLRPFTVEISSAYPKYNFWNGITPEEDKDPEILIPSYGKIGWYYE